MSPLSIPHLKLLLAHSDTILTHLSRLLTPHAGLTSTLTTLYYTLMLLHSRLTNLLSKKYEALALSIASKASGALIPGETMVAHIQAPHLRLTQFCAATKALGDATEDVRLCLRLFGLLGVYTWGKEVYAKQHRDPAVNLLIWARIGAYTGYQLFENMAYLVRRGVVRGERAMAREARWWAWSGRFWVAEVVIEMLRLARVRQLRFNEEFGAEKVGDGETVGVRSRELEERWRRDWYATAGWFLPGLHFSFLDEETSPVTEGWMGVSGMIPGLVGLRDAWRETA